MTLQLVFSEADLPPAEMGKIAIGLKGDPGPPGPPGPAGGAAASQAMRMVHQILHRSAHTRGANAHEAPPSTSGAVVAPVASVPPGFTRSYPASVSEGPSRFYGGDPVLVSGGVRLTQAHYSDAVGAIGLVGWHEVTLIGDVLVVELDKGFPYRFLVEEQGGDRYVPSGSVTIEPLGAGEGLYLHTITFPSRRRWRLTIEPSRFGEERAGRVGAMYVREVDSSLQMMARDDDTMVVIGSSSIQCTNGFPADSWAHILGAGLGFKDIRLSAVHSTSATISFAGAKKWSERREDYVAPNPRLLVFHAQFLTSDVSAEVAAVMAEVNYARAHLPNALIVVQMIEGPGNWSVALECTAGVIAAVAALNDPFIRAFNLIPTIYEEAVEIGTGNAGTPANDGPRDWLVGGNDHYSVWGDRVIGEQTLLRFIEELKLIYYGLDTSTTVASIAPSSGVQNLEVGAAVDVLLGTIVDGTPTGSPGGTAPAGCAFVMVGQQLRLTGTPTTAGAISVTITVPTDNGEVSYTLTGAVTVDAPASIAPTSGNLALTVDTPVDTVLGTISGGTPTGSGITGTPPAGCAFSTAGQDLKITGTPTTEAADISTTIAVPTDDGDVVFSLTGSVAAASGPWTQLDLPALYAWYHSDEPTNTLDGNTLQAFDDKSGNNRDGVPSFPRVSSQPLVNQYFDTIDDQLDGKRGALSYPAKYGFFDMGDGDFARNVAGVSYALLFTPFDQSITGTHALMASTFTGGNARCYIGMNNGNVICGGRRLDTDALSGINDAATQAQDVPFLVIAVFDYANNTVKLRINGTARTPNTAAFTSGAGMSQDVAAVGTTLGHQEGSNYSPGHYYETLSTRAALSDSDAEKLEGAILHGWGLEGSLPSDHPYKASPP